MKKADLADPLELSALAEEILEEESKNPFAPQNFCAVFPEKKTELALAQEMSEKNGRKRRRIPSRKLLTDTEQPWKRRAGWNFDDLLIRTVSLLRENCPAIRRFCSQFSVSSGRRVSGYQPSPVRADPGVEQRGKRAVCYRRSGSGDLRLQRL